jgi:hypothetical protein
MLFFDGSARNKKAGAGVVLIDPNGEQVKYMVLLDFEATNNMADVTVRVLVMLDIYFVSVKYVFVKCKACVCLCEAFKNLKCK